ncbi:right-handed parallel beta-helix repeat-containing protein [Candidatus Desantisbacteria bacterium]|nr:right-handed parallel beta-helix repeat-containing protein [Candidatus Desantisbacteria bacterium]
MKIYLFIVITLIFFGSIVFASDYYIDARNGNDSKNGLSKANAWQTWDKLRVQTYTIGDTISFKCGEQWDIPYNNYWTFDDSGTVNNYIEITSYGTGPKPIWNAVESISGSWSDKGWNIWKRKLNGRVERCILGDIESVEADNVEDIDGISKYWYGDDSCLYVYSKSNPDIVYSQVKVVRIGWCILFQNANYVKLNNIELRGGSVDTIRLRNNCSYISIENCIITYSGKSGIMGMVEEGSGNTLTNVVIKNNFISGEQDLVNKTIRGINEDGISMWRACSDWHIIGNTIKNYSHSGISIQTYTSSESGSNNNIIEDNTFTAGNSPYFRAFDFHGPEGKCMRIFLCI